MTKSLRIARQNHIDGSIVTAAHSISSLPASNLKDDDIQKIWRDTSNANTNLTADLSAQLEIGMISLINTNILGTDTLRVRVSSADPTGAAGDVYDQASISPNINQIYPNWLYFIEPAVTGRYVRIDFSGLTNTPEAGRWVIAPTWIPSHHISFGFQPLWRDQSRQIYSLGQNVFTDIINRQRGYRFTVKGLTTTEVQNEVSELNRLRGIGKDIMVCIDKDSTNLGRDSIWGLMEEPALPTQIDRALWEVEFMIWERL